jgi:hypothetical protein
MRSPWGTRSSLAVCLTALLAPALAGAQFDCTDVFHTQAGPGAVTIVHESATYNCCADSFSFTVERIGQVIEVTELESLTQPCDCMCCFDVVAVIGDLAAGAYSIHLHWLDFEAGQWQLADLEVEVPGQPGTTGARLLECQNSGCGGFTGVHEPEYWQVAPLTWGALKTRYR